MADTWRTDVFPLTILRDTRERRPWEFDGYPVETSDVTLSTGDYTLPTWCTHEKRTDTYHPRFALERKSGDDFINSLTWGRDRFKAELRRATDWPRPLSIVVEGSWEAITNERGCMRSRDVHPDQIIGTVSAWEQYYNVSFHFTGTRRKAELCGFYLLVHSVLLGMLDGECEESSP